MGKFDALNLALTLEHAVDPVAILEKTYNVLSPGGIVSIEVPNDFSPLQTAVRRALDKPIYWLAPPHHINYFDFNSLSGVLERAGFAVVHKTATPMGFFLMMDDDYLGNDLVGRVCHEKRMRFETNLKKRTLFRIQEGVVLFFAEKGIGREVLMARNKPASKKDELELPTTP